MNAINLSTLKRFQSKTYRSGAFYSVAMNCVAKVLNMGVALIIAYYYGINDKADICFYCINTTMLLATFFRGVNSTVLIPEAMRRREHVSSKDAMAFLNIFFYLIIAASGLILGMLLINPAGVITGMTGFDIDALVLHKDLLTLSLPLFFLMAVTFYLSDILVSHKCFTLPMVLNAINSLIVIIFVVSFNTRLDILSVIIGMNIGYLIQLIALLVMMQYSLKWDYRILKTTISAKVWKDVLAAFAGNFMTMFSAYLPLLLFSHLGSGLIASLNYARRIAELPLQLVIMQFSSVFGIRMNQLFAQKDWAKINEVFRESVEFLVFILIPLSTYIFVFSSDIVNLLYLHGHFEAEASLATVTLLKYLGMLLPFMAVITLVARLFMAGQIVQMAFWYQLLLNAISATSFVFAVHFWGYKGYPMAQVSILFLHATAGCMYLTFRHFKMIQYSVILRYIAIMIAMNVFIGSLLYFMRAALPGNSLSHLMLGAVCYAVIIIGLDQIIIVNRTARIIRDTLLCKFAALHVQNNVKRDD